MEDTQRDHRVDSETAAPQTEASDGRESSAGTDPRLLANPRRVRRN